MRRSSVEPAYHAEVDERDAVAGKIEHVAGVRVRVKEAVFNDHLQHGVRTAPGKYLAVQASLVGGGKLAPRYAVDEFLHAHPFAGPLPVDTGSDDDRRSGHAGCFDVSRLTGSGQSRRILIRVTCKIGRDALGIAAFGGEIKLAPQRLLKLPDDFLGVKIAQFGVFRLGSAARRINQRRSASMTGRIPGLRTLTTTGLPSSRRAWYTCAIDAAAMGSGSKTEKISSGAAPRSSPSCCWISA